MVSIGVILYYPIVQIIVFFKIMVNKTIIGKIRAKRESENIANDIGLKMKVIKAKKFGWTVILEKNGTEL